MPRCSPDSQASRDLTPPAPSLLCPTLCPPTLLNFLCFLDYTSFFLTSEPLPLLRVPAFPYLLFDWLNFTSSRKPSVTLKDQVSWSCCVPPPRHLV